MSPRDTKSIYVKPETHKRAKLLAVELSITLDDVITHALDALEGQILSDSLSREQRQTIVRQIVGNTAARLHDQLLAIKSPRERRQKLHEEIIRAAGEQLGTDDRVLVRKFVDKLIS